MSFQAFDSVMASRPRQPAWRHRHRFALLAPLLGGILWTLDGLVDALVFG